MTRLILAMFLGTVAAAAVAWRLGGALGAGVLAGFLLGAGMSGLGVLWQRHVMLRRPERAMHAMALSLLAKLVALALGVACFRFVEVAGSRADWRSFLVAFGASVALVVPLGALDAVRVLARPRPSTSSEPAEVAG